MQKQDWTTTGNRVTRTHQLAEMLEGSPPILNEDPDGFMVVLEEEATDNFNNNNGQGLVEAAIRADDAIGVHKISSDNEPPNTC